MCFQTTRELIAQYFTFYFYNLSMYLFTLFLSNRKVTSLCLMIYSASNYWEVFFNLTCTFYIRKLWNSLDVTLLVEVVSLCHLRGTKVFMLPTVWLTGSFHIGYQGLPHYLCTEVGEWRPKAASGTPRGSNILCLEFLASSISQEYAPVNFYKYTLESCVVQYGSH